ncbi:UNVERIFIED_CONTAM: hypothetical protein RMT77_019418 [Armadillidium vulgare]
MDPEIFKMCKELGLKGKEINEFFKEREAAKKESEERAAAEAEKIREFELKKIELQLRSGISNHTTTLNNQNNRIVENFKLAPFIDGEDDIFRYIEDFEYYAQINKWNPNNWGIYLATFLTGNALGIYARMPSNEANDYFKLKCALLPKFYNTEVKCRLRKEERNLYDKDNFEIELVKSEHEIVVSHLASGNESFQQMISSQESPIKGEDSFPQPETFAEKELPSSQDMIFLSTSSKWENNEDEISSLYKTSAEQDEEEENLVTSDVIKRTENVLFSKELSNRSSISHKVYIEKKKEKKIERSRTPTPEWGKVDIREAKKKGSSTQIAISSKTESQAGRLRMKELKQEFKSEVEFSAFEGRSIIEVNQDDHEYDMHIVKSRDRSLYNEKKAVKRSWLDCEKASQSSLPQNKRNSENLDKKHVKIQRNKFSNQQEMWDLKGFYVKVDPKSDDNLQKYSTENQSVNMSNQRRMEIKKKFDIHVNPKFGEDYIDVCIKEVVKVQVDEGKMVNSQSEKGNKQMNTKSYIVTLHREIDIFKISHELEFEEDDSAEDFNIVAISELTSQSEDVKVESDSHLFFFTSFLSSSSLSSFSGHKEREIKRKKKKKKKYHKNKRKRYNDINGDERRNSNYKCDRETPNKRFIIQAEKLKLYKYRRKRKVRTRKHQEIRENTKSESRALCRVRLITNRFHIPDERWNVMLSRASLKFACYQDKSNSFIEVREYEEVFTSSGKYKRKSDRLPESSALKIKKKVGEF